MNHRLALPKRSNHLTQKIKIVGHRTRYIDELRRKNPCACIPETAFPEPYLLTETENTIIDDIFELLNKHGLTSHQSMNLLERVAKGTTH